MVVKTFGHIWTHLIDSWLVDDVPGVSCIAEGAQSLIVAAAGRWDSWRKINLRISSTSTETDAANLDSDWLTCNHDGFGVATQTVFKKPGEDRVPVGNEALSAPAAWQRAGLTTHSAPFTLTEHTVNALTAAEHLRVLG